MATLTKQGIINSFEALADKLDIEIIKNNKLEDFITGDVVKCTYFNNNLYRVLGHYQDKVTITKVDLRDDILHVNPMFLKKQQVNKDAIRVLFDED